MRTDRAKLIPAPDGAPVEDPAPPSRRNAAATAERILRAAMLEFAEHGFMGARVDAIAQRAGANTRMLYHYFGSKNDLYVKVLESVFSDIRLQEQRLNLGDLAPTAAMLELFRFTYAHFAANPLFIRLLTGENLLDARHLARSSSVPKTSATLLKAMGEVLARGAATAEFRAGIDPLQLYVTMVAMSYFHISNGPTLSRIFTTRLDTPRWRAERQRHAADMILAYLRP